MLGKHHNCTNLAKPCGQRHSRNVTQGHQKVVSDPKLNVDHISLGGQLAPNQGQLRVIKLKSTKIIEKTSEIVKEYPKNKIKKISKIEKIAKKSIIYNRR